MWYFVFLFSLVSHEAAHAWAAMKLGDPTAYEGGQVSLDPVPHIQREPLGTVVVPILSYALGGWMMGWASAPYDIFWAIRFPKRAALMALAGPVANLLLMISSGLLIRLGMTFGIFHIPGIVDFTQIVTAEGPSLFSGLAVILSVMFSLNLILFIFNLIPFPPLDGSGVVPLFLNEDIALKYLEFIHQPFFSILGLFFAWKLMDYVYYPFHTLSLSLLYFGR